MVRGEGLGTPVVYLLSGSGTASRPVRLCLYDGEEKWRDKHESYKGKKDEDVE